MAQLLFLGQGSRIVRLLPARSLRTVHAGRIILPLQGFAWTKKSDSVPTTNFGFGTSITSHDKVFFLANQTRRCFGGRQPLCGTGVTSRITEISRPIA